ncbi:TraR/DksA C4-type zinc finger protein [Sanguibacter sp. 25GB23B1]|uniref:TraR/DksA family transcriptional regulator n=1 Tax=unclassified Sanguibacter TaxID=2645534 RepID=UPI0032AEF6B3
MTSSPDPQSLEPSAVLLERQRTLTIDLQRVLDDLQEVRDARGGQSDDDEHDPEGATMSSQWSHAMGIRADLEARLGEVDRALLRIEEGTYGFCVQCGTPIPGERLAARPAADRCVHCASSEVR